MSRGTASRKAPPLALRVAVLGVLAATVLVLLGWTRSVTRRAASPYPIAAAARFDPRLATLGAADTDTIAGDPALEYHFRPGETVSDVLAALDFPPQEASEVLGVLAELADLRRLRPRDGYAALYGPDDSPTGFRLLLDGKGRAAVYREADRWSGRWEPFTRRVEVAAVSATLDGSLETSLRNAGAEGVLAYLMADVLQWDLDFNRDLRTGDRFWVLYERVYLDGSFHALGNVVALAYENLGRRLEAYRFEDGEEAGYYDADGRPLQKLFLRSPLKFSRVTSRFSNRRFHPILKTYRPHYGVDYGAPTGTPVRVTANGVVLSAGWDRGGGKVVKVRHPNGYLTAYLHLSRFADGIRSGARVRQGDVIAYVGSTGLATASHLDYRVQHDGHWIDPLSIKSVPAEPIPQDRLASYLERRDLMRASLFDGAPWPAGEEEGDRLAFVDGGDGVGLH
ncbi:MAG: peptidoglycan DD-metalloendopeptidase family protein [Thermoanaerobaculia bacterium]